MIFYIFFKKKKNVTVVQGGPAVVREDFRLGLGPFWSVPGAADITRKSRRYGRK